MPRPHPNGEPLAVTVEMPRDALLFARSTTALRVRDGRVAIPDEDGDTAWVGLDLACATCDHPGGCAHQLMAALRLARPLAPDPDVTPLSLQRLAHSLAAAALPFEGSSEGRVPLAALPELGEEGRQGELLTRPGLTDAELLEWLRQARYIGPAVLGLAIALRAGPVRDWLWGQEQQRTTRPPMDIPTRYLLGRLVATEPAATLPARLAALPGESIQLLLTPGHMHHRPGLAEHLPRMLSRPQLAAILARFTDREARLTLGRLIAAQATPARLPGR